MAVPGWQPHLPPATPAEIQPAPSVTFFRIQIEHRAEPVVGARVPW